MNRPDGVIDICGYWPTPRRLASDIHSIFADPGYRHSFGGRWAAVHGLDPGLLDVVAGLAPERVGTEGAALVAEQAPSVADAATTLRGAGIGLSVVSEGLPQEAGLPDLERLAAEVVAADGELVAFARIAPAHLERSLDLARRAVTDWGFRGMTLTPFWSGLTPSDPMLEPVYRTCVELGVPIWIHTGMNWRKTAPIELEHPRHIDEVAGRFPELRLIMGHGGWPWIREVVAIAMRHDHVYIDTSSYLPRYLATPGAGWESLLYFMDRNLRDRVVFGSMWGILGTPAAEIVGQARALPLKPATLEAWLGGNARRLLGESR